MRTLLSRRHWLQLLPVLLPAVGLAQEAPRKPGLVFGLITPRAAEQTRANWTPFVDRMGEAIKQPIELRLFAEPRLLVDAFRKGEIDLGWMGNAAALEVVESGSGAVFAQMVTREGNTGYKSVLIVPKASNLGGLRDVLANARQLRFSDGDANSTSGHLVPSYFAFSKNGVDDVQALFKSVTNASHQKNLMKVARGETDVATANNEELGFFARDYPDLAKGVRVIWESPVIPQSPLMWRAGLAPDLRKRILKFTVDFGKTEDEKKLLQKLNDLSGFRQSNNRQLVSVADLEMFKERQAINNDSALSAEERARRIDQVIRRGSRLDLILKLSAADR